MKAGRWLRLTKIIGCNGGGSDLFYQAGLRREGCDVFKKKVPEYSCTFGHPTNSLE